MTKDTITPTVIRAIDKVCKDLLEADARMAVKYISDRLIVRATRTLFRGKIDKRGNFQITVTIGRPNYREREFIKLLKKAGEPFPVRNTILKFPVKR